MQKEFEQYLQLKKDVQRHNYYYHTEDAPIISDGAYDVLLGKLRTIENAYPEWVKPDSPTQRMGAPISEKFAKVSHPAPVLSLANAFDGNDIRTWVERLSKLDDRIRYCDYVLEPKIDGLTVVLRYENGLLVQGATRGDGMTGEDITANIRTIRSIPLCVPISDGSVSVPTTLVVRGEVFMLNSDFEKINAENAARGEKIWQNPRNSAAGSLRQLNAQITAQRPLKIFVYQILYYEGGEAPETQWERLEYLRGLGFPVSPDSQFCNDFETLLERVQGWGEIRKTLDYDIDGVVVKVNDLRIAEDLGFSGKDPRGAIALKFPAMEVTTVLEQINVRVGRTGVLTPQAVLTPVACGGVSVKQATLHNFDFIADLDIRIGDSVLIKRAGDVIPYVVGPLLALRKGNEVIYVPPQVCPACTQSVERINGEAALRCVNSACPAQLIRNIEHFVSKDALNIEGLGGKIVEQIVEAGLICDSADLYTLQRNDLIAQDGFKEKKADNLLTAIAESKQQPLGRLLNGLGIHGVGEVMAQTLADQFGSLDALMTASTEQLTEIEGVGPNIADAVCDWFVNEANRTVLEKFRAIGFWPVHTGIHQTTSATLSGQTVVVTGTLERFTRDEIKALIVQHGGKVTDSVSKKTSLIIAGENAGSKLDKGRTLNIPILSEAEFLVHIQPAEPAL